MKIVRKYLSLILLLNLPQAYVQEPSELDLSSYLKLGSKLIEFSIFKIDVYVVSYHVDKKNESNAINLNYKMNVSKNLSIKGWEEGFKWMSDNEKRSFQNAIGWIRESTVDLYKNDNLTIFVTKNMTVLKRNNKTIAVSKDPLVSKIILTPWVGDKPIREDVKKALLGK